MATFRFRSPYRSTKTPTLPAQEDNALRIWAFSLWRTKWQLACAFLDGYGHLKYQMYGLYDNPDGTLKVKFVNFRDTQLLFGQAFHCICEMVVFTGANIFTNYWNQFPNNGNFIHNVLPELPMAPEVPPHYLAVSSMAREVPPPYLEVPMSQEPTLSLELSLVPMSRAVTSSAD